MKTPFSLVAALVIIGVSVGHAAIGVTGYHNIHIWTTNPEAAVEWYVKYLGAVEGGTGAPAVRFGEALVVFRKTDTARASVGSVIDHYGISVPDIEATMQRLEGSGAKILEPVREVPGLFKLAFIEDPFGAKVELVQDAEWPDFHHVHLRVPDPTATLAWYEDVIGGTRDKLKGKIEGLRYGGVWLVAQDSGGEKMAPERRPGDPECCLGHHRHGRSRCRPQGGWRQDLGRTICGHRHGHRGVLRRSARRHRQGDRAIAVGSGEARSRGSGDARSRGSGCA